MQDNVWIATIAGLALGIAIALLIIHLKKSDTMPLPLTEQPVSFVYDDQNRLQSLVPMNTTNVKLRQVGDKDG